MLHHHQCKTRISLWWVPRTQTGADSFKMPPKKRNKRRVTRTGSVLPLSTNMFKQAQSRHATHAPTQPKTVSPKPPMVTAGGTSQKQFSSLNKKKISTHVLAIAVVPVNKIRRLIPLPSPRRRSRIGKRHCCRDRCGDHTYLVHAYKVPINS